MTDQLGRLPRFFITARAPCPYLRGRVERKVFAELKGPGAQQLCESLGRIGFRRSQNVVYRPSCEGCQACVSVRIVARDFRPGATQRRVLRRNADLEVTACDPWATEEQFALLKRYLAARHPDGGMSTMDAYDFADMIETSPVDTVVVEYREPSPDPSRPGRLVGACLTDKQSDGLSMVYSFYDPDRRDRLGLGTFIILDHVLRAAAVGLPYVYLGYWVEGSPSMDYKRRFHPLEALTPQGWRLLPRLSSVPPHPARNRDHMPGKSA
ncbi:MAG: arginyltransferase [Sphingomonadaceae bacterium]|uniref:arginyltransferase n=1 Tax=Thermaurantiacus sp. TaxID=2820283 RepID=UPI00298ED93F|nr:arginyltransferase [Thermaurantiacus sp.]MCS6985866.1 arginyltransferase [Sphingomonadaceae bacterium]MDW8413865.1 arginyltransferase [Thermaurantiacus sp.]